MTTKICKCCGAEKELTEFYKHPQMPDGHLNICKECKVAYARKYREDNRKKIREYDRHRPNQKERYLKQKEQRENDINKKEAFYAAHKKWNLANKHKKNANNIVKRAIESGKIIKPERCQICGAMGDLHAHHEDYSQPLKVVFVCPHCHGLIHRYKHILEREMAS